MDLKMDGYSKDIERLDDMDWLRLYLVTLADKLGVTIVNGPTIVSFKEVSGDPDAGLSGFAIIAESHLAVHTWPKLGYIQNDVSSCKPFNADVVCRFIGDWMNIGEVTYCVVDSRRPVPPGNNARSEA